MKNLGYFLRETKAIFRLSLRSNVLSLLSMGLIFFILTLIIASGWATGKIVTMIQNEAELNIYFNESIGEIEVQSLMEEIGEIEGVGGVHFIGEEEAYGRMVEVLGQEAEVLKFFDENPFSPFIEVEINLDRIEAILKELEDVEGIDYIRDNKEVLDQMNRIAQAIEKIGYLVVAATGITTLVIISHMIRLGIYSNKEQIDTLRLLGAPESFIAFPYVLCGLLLTLGGGILAILLVAFILKYFYVLMVGAMPLLPIPAMETVLYHMVLWILPLCGLLGALGSIMGLNSSES